MEYVEGGSLGDLLRNKIALSETQIRMIAAQLLLTVDFMSRKSMLHRDLKPENILLLNSKDLE
jgi:3-phosphoinositide dependent protein kinase-1